MSLVVNHPGVFATVQDLGRHGYRATGVSPGGAFDRGSAGLANALLGNPSDAAVVELTLVGGRYEALAPLALAIAGAPLPVTVRARDGRERSYALPVCFSVGAGDRLALGGVTRGARTYLAVAGGWRTPVVLGSRSAETPLSPGDVLPCAPGSTPVRHPDGADDPFDTAGTGPLRVIDGPDAAAAVGGSLFGGSGYRVGPRSDRAGLRLLGPGLDLTADPDRVSTPVAPGAVQVAGGRPIVLGVACGTMGGYPHVGHVISADLDRLAQARPGDTVGFVRVTLGEARRLDRGQRSERARRLMRVAAAARDGVRCGDD